MTHRLLSDPRILREPKKKTHSKCWFGICKMNSREVLKHMQIFADNGETLRHFRQDHCYPIGTNFDKCKLPIFRRFLYFRISISILGCGVFSVISPLRSSQRSSNGLSVAWKDGKDHGFKSMVILP